MKQDSHLESDILVGPKKTQSIEKKPTSLYLNTGRKHSIWKPQGKEGKLSDGGADALESRHDLLDRRKRLQYRVIATQEVLKVQREELEMEEIEEEEVGDVHHPMPKEQKRWQKAITKVIESNAKARKREEYVKFHDSITQWVAMMSKSSYSDSGEIATKEEATSSRDRKTVPILNRRIKKRLSKPFLSQSNLQI